MKRYLMANWKNEKSVDQAMHMVRLFTSGPLDLRRFLDKLDIVLAVPHLALGSMKDGCACAGFGLSAQDGASEGGYGRVSMAQLAEVCGTVVVGHSSAKKSLGDDDTSIRKKVAAARNVGLRVVLCVGEDGAQYAAGDTASVLRSQLGTALEGIGGFEGITVLYEPVWAMGTGQSPSPEEVGKTIRQIREICRELGAPADHPVIYAGSVRPENAEALIMQEGVSGLAVGAASLDPDKFYAIAAAVYGKCEE